MKDEGIRHLVRTEIKLHEYDNPHIPPRHYPLDDITIKDCPKCKHPVLAQQIKCVVYYGGWGWGTPPLTLHIKNPAVNQCLTCGTKFTCPKECVCKIVEE